MDTKHGAIMDLLDNLGTPGGVQVPPKEEEVVTWEETEEAPPAVGPQKRPCPECGKLLTWLADGSRPRQHKCENRREPNEPKPPAQEPAKAAPSGVTADMVIGAYVKTRDEIAAKKKALAEELADLMILQEKREKWLKGEMDRLGVESFKSKHGTAFVDWKDSARVKDRNIFLEWVHADWAAREQFLNSAVSKTAVKQCLTDGEDVPPGVDYSKFKDVKIRRA